MSELDKKAEAYAEMKGNGIGDWFERKEDYKAGYQEGLKDLAALKREVVKDFSDKLLVNLNKWDKPLLFLREIFASINLELESYEASEKGEGENE